MIRLGLTGGIAAGKSTVARLLQRDHGAPVLDLDQVTRALMVPGSDILDSIRQRFGNEVFTAGGGLDRKALGARVSHDEHARRALERIVHPTVFREAQQWLHLREQEGSAHAVIEAPLLVETGYHRRLHRLAVVACDPEEQVRRLVRREGITAEEARRWIDAQAPLERKLESADVVIWNDGDLESLSRRTAEAWQALTAPLAPGDES